MKYPIFGAMRSGRTYRMLTDAVIAAGREEHCFVVAAGRIDYLTAMAGEIAEKYGLVASMGTRDKLYIERAQALKRDGEVTGCISFLTATNPKFDPTRCDLKGVLPECKVLIDHTVPEWLFGALLDKVWEYAPPRPTGMAHAD